MTKETITLSSIKGDRTIQKDRIISCKQYLVGTLIEVDDGNHYLLKERLSELKSFLNDAYFFRVSHRELINLNYIDAVFTHQIVLMNNKTIPLNGVKKRRLMEKIAQKVFI